MIKIFSMQLISNKYLYLILISLLIVSEAYSQKEATLKGQPQIQTYLRSGEVKMNNNRPTIFVNKKPITPLLYALVDRRNSWFNIPQQNIKLFCESNINLVQVDIFLDDIWFPDSSIRIDTALMQIRGVLEVCPDANIFLRLHVNAPRWWQALHPEESIIYGNTESIGKGENNQTWMSGDVSNVSRFSLASKQWLNATSFVVKEFCRRLSKAPEGNALVSIQVACGVYGEWHYFGFLDNDPDLSQPMMNYFRNWLRNKYKTNEGLREAWGDKDVRFETAEVPSSKDRNTTTHGVFRDLVKERNVIDYYEAQHLVVAEDILHFCKLIKESWPRPIITGSFYGYFYSLFTREAAGGHLAIDTILKSPYIDFLAAPQAYYPDNEATGDPYHSRGLLESVRLHGKIWLEEMDQEPPLTNKSDSNYAASVKESIARIRRNIMYTATKGMGMWFYDFGIPRSTQNYSNSRDKLKEGYWNQPNIMADIKKMKLVLDRRLTMPYISDADVLMVYDTRSFYSLVSQTKKTNITNILINWTAVNAMKAGYAFDAVYLNDLKLVDLSKYKVIIFNNTFVIDDQQRQFINDKVMKDNRDIIWFYAPGYSDDKKLDVNQMSKLTGISLVKTDSLTLPIIKTTGFPGKQVVYDIRVTPANNSSKILRNYHFADYDSPYRPLFSIDDSKAESFGIYVSNNMSAIAKKKLRFCNSWYVALPAYEPELIGGLLQGTRAHKFSDDSVIVYSGNGLLSVHTQEGGVKNIILSNGKSIRLHMDKNSTFILNNETGEVIVGNVSL